MTEPPEDIGQVPDYEIAERLGVTKQRVQQIRKTLGVPSHSKFLRSQVNEERDWGALPWDLLSNQSMSEVYDIPVQDVRNQRKRLGKPQLISARELLVHLLKIVVEE
jgi:hypothetical protein